MEPSKPSLELLRQLSDAHVLGALIDEPRLTRAQIAAATGLSKPTVGESVRRLVAGGAVRDTGEVTTGRGRAGTLYALAEDLGVALAVSLAPDGVRAEAVDVRGVVVASSVSALSAPATPSVVEGALLAAVREVCGSVVGAARLAVVSAADPVDRHTGRLVHLPDAPFLVGELSPVEVLAPLVLGAVVVDNDVNWAARAERAAAAGGADDFAYLYLDAGLGCALVADGQVLRGAGGLAGEVAHVVTVGAGGRAVTFTEVFAELGLRQPGSTAIDVAAVLTMLARSEGDGVAALGLPEQPAGDDAGARAVPDLSVGDDAANAVLGQICDATAGVLAAIVALSDPAEVVVGGGWGSHPALVAELGEAFGRMPRSIPVRVAAVVDQPSLTGAREEAVHLLRAWVTAGASPA